MSARSKRPAATVRAPSQFAAAPPVDPGVVEGFIQEGRTRATPGRPGTSRDVPTSAPRAPQGSKVLVARKSGAVRRRMTVYLSEDTAEALTRLCRNEGREQSNVVEAALLAWFER